MRKKNIIFDLDGTIIDSVDGINMAFNQAYAELYDSKCVFDITNYVGPPIKDIFVKVCKETNLNKVDSFVKLFQDIYDSTFYTECIIYNGISELLDYLKEQKVNCFIATNKRLKPTKNILNHLNIHTYFKSIYAIDSVQNKYINKTGMIKDLLDKEEILACETVLIGDTHHDQTAAQVNDVEFIYADYGYGDISNIENKLTGYLSLSNFINLIK